MCDKITDIIILKTATLFDPCPVANESKFEMLILIDGWTESVILALCVPIQLKARSESCKTIFRKSGSTMWKSTLN